MTTEYAVQVQIFGETYTVRGTEPPEYVQRVAQYVDGTFYELAKGDPRLPSAKVGILASLTLADELFKAEEERVRAVEKVAELSQLLDQAIARDAPASAQG